MPAKTTKFVLLHSFFAYIPTSESISKKVSTLNKF